jgi:hypothetical protein
VPHFHRVAYHKTKRRPDKRAPLSPQEVVMMMMTVMMMIMMMTHYHITE